MIEAMPRPRPPHLQRSVTRHGKVVWYVREGRGPRKRLRAAYGTDEFWSEYRAALSGKPATPHRKPAGSLSWLIDRYRETSAWTDLAMATRRNREAAFRQVIEASGDEPAKAVTRKHIVAGRERRARSPGMANHFLAAMRGLFKWAIDAEIGDIAIDPTAGVRALSTRSDGHHVWTEAEIATFEAYWPVGTRERLAFDILRWTGLRREDAALLGRQHIRKGVIHYRTLKTREDVTLPISAPLARSIAATPATGLTLVAKPNGDALNDTYFGDWFVAAARKAGVPGTAHGVRKAAATISAENGATEKELEAIFGWRGGRTAAIYTRKADRAKLARNAIGTLEARTCAQGESESEKMEVKSKP